MRIAVVSEVSARDKNKHIIEALQSIDAKVYNIGMTDNKEEPELTYIQTGLMAAAALNTGAADFVVGGCGTGQGFMLSVMQYPGVYCGHINEPLDAWLFSQINGGNCVSLALNKGFGWAGDINLRYIFEKLFSDPSGQGYPLHRSASQKESRLVLSKINGVTHKDFAAIITSLDKDLRDRAFHHAAFAEFIRDYSENGELRDLILNK